MAVETLISVEEYLNTSYEADMEYVDGVLVDRNVGEFTHSLAQSKLIVALHGGRLVLPSVRFQTAESRYRVPDICVLLTPPKTRFLYDAPFLIVEILSEDDRMSRMLEKLDEYERKGVPNIWVIDPRLETMSVYAAGALREIRDDTIATTDGQVQLTRQEIFQDLPR